MERPPFKHPEKKVIINVPPVQPAQREVARDSSPTIVNRHFAPEQRPLVQKTRIAIGAALGAMAVATGIILTKGITDPASDKKTADVPTAAPTSEKELLATNWPTATPTAEIVPPSVPSLKEQPKHVEEEPTATATATAIVTPTATATPDNTVAVPANTAAPTAKPLNTPRPPKKTEIMREVPF